MSFSSIEKTTFDFELGLLHDGTTVVSDWELNHQPSGRLGCCYHVKPSHGRLTCWCTWPVCCSMNSVKRM